jgi:hypothetical protein
VNQDKKIIAHVGTHGTGKTTSVFNHAALLSLQYPNKNVGVIPEMARYCPFPLNRDLHCDTFSWLFATQLFAELEAGLTYDLCVSDRSIFDCIAYANIIIPSFSTIHHVNIAVDHFHRHYAKIIFHKASSIHCLSDGFRDTEPVLRLKVENALISLLTECGIKFETVDHVPSI